MKEEKENKNMSDEQVKRLTEFIKKFTQILKKYYH